MSTHSEGHTDKAALAPVEDSGKLVQEEERAVGAVAWAVYRPNLCLTACTSPLVVVIPPLMTRT